MEDNENDEETREKMMKMYGHGKYYTWTKTWEYVPRQTDTMRTKVGGREGKECREQ